MWLIKMLIESPENIETVREHLDFGSIQNEALKELLKAILQSESERVDESVLFDRVQSEEAQTLLSKLMFEETYRKDPLYSPEWWRGLKEGREEKKAFKDLSKEIAEAERSGNTEHLNELLREKRNKKRSMVEIVETVKDVPVDRSAESVIGG
jgi:hypothetical protein